MFRRIFILIVAVLAVPGTALAEGPLKVVATTSDLASIAESVGGEAVRVRGLVRGNRDPHFVEVRPSMVMKLRDADLFLIVGMDLDIWARSLMNAARNPAIQYGAKGFLDLSVGVPKLEVPSVKVDASMGHLHVQGNPHYWLDPENAKIMARSIAQKLSELDPENARLYETNLERFTDELSSRIDAWKESLRPHLGEKIMTYHRSWSYFLNRFGLVSAGELEPKPGIPPTPSHLADVIRRIGAEEVRLILAEVFYEPKSARYVSEKTGIPAVFVANSVGGSAGTEDYISMIDQAVGTIVKQLGNGGS